MRKVFKFERVEYLLSPGYEHKGSEAYICCGGIHHYFDFPESTKIIWLTISDKSLGKDSYKVLFDLKGVDFLDTEMPYRETTDSDFDCLIEYHNLDYRELWVKVEY